MKYVNEGMRKLLEGYRAFYQGNPARKGFCALQAERIANTQNPHSMVISCFDSRVCPEAIFGTNDGHICVHRNMLGKVDPKDYSMMASLRFASSNLKVQNIIVLGHSDCNAVKKLQYVKETAKEIQDWLCLSPAAYEGETLEDAVKHNVLVQLDRLGRIDFIAEAKKTGLHVEGMYFHIDTGFLDCYDEAAKVWRRVEV